MILGLPRSRTQWLANFMTTSDVFCWHELTARVGSLDEFMDRLKLKYKYVGVSDTVAYLIEQKFNCPKVIIHRDIKECNRSSQKLYGTGQDFTDMFTKAMKKMEKIDGLHINFEDIDDSLEDIWNYCTKLPFDNDRAEALKEMKVETKKTHYSEKELSYVLQLMRGEK